jgi:hypothetical protein
MIQPAEAFERSLSARVLALRCCGYCLRSTGQSILRSSLLHSPHSLFRLLLGGNFHDLVRLGGLLLRPALLLSRSNLLPCLRGELPALRFTGCCDEGACVPESGDLGVECSDDFLRIHVRNYSKSPESTELIRCFRRSQAIFVGMDRWSLTSSGNTVQELRRRPTNCCHPRHDHLADVEARGISSHHFWSIWDFVALGSGT